MRFTYQPGSKPIEGYTIQRGIYRGGMGEVYYALSDAGKEVALKLLLHEQEVELRGVQECLNLKHPNLVTLFDVRTNSAGEKWVVMEYVKGVTLADVLVGCINGLPTEEVQAWFNGVVEGVRFLHEHGIVHRDLKPANVFRENGVVKVGDVGLCKRLSGNVRDAHSRGVGTVHYMAPEIGRGQYGPQIDVYSLGVMLFELLSGQLPFTGESSQEIIVRHMTDAPNLDQIPARFQPVIARALEKDPQRRTQSVQELQNDFMSALGLQPDSIETVIPQNKSGRSSRIGVPRSISTRTANQAAYAYAQYAPHPETLFCNSESEQNSPSAAKPKRRSSSVKPQKRWMLWVGIVFGLWLGSPGTLRSWSGVAIIGATIAALSMVRIRPEDPFSRVGGQLDSSRPWWRDFSSDYLGTIGTSISVGTASSALLATGMLLVTEFFRRTPMPVSADVAALCVATSILATTVLLITRELLFKDGWFDKNPRTTFLVAGVLIGTSAYFLDSFLLVNFSVDASGYSPAFRRFGIHSLIEHDLNPSWLGYVVFFGGLMFLHGWSASMSVDRPDRLSIGRLIWAGFAAWLMTTMFAFPQWLAILWGVTISAAVQLSSPWSPRASQVLYVEN